MSNRNHNLTFGQGILRAGHFRLAKTVVKLLQTNTNKVADSVIGQFTDVATVAKRSTSRERGLTRRNKGKRNETKKGDDVRAKENWRNRQTRMAIRTAGGPGRQQGPFGVGD